MLSRILRSSITKPFPEVAVTSPTRRFQVQVSGDERVYGCREGRSVLSAFEAAFPGAVPVGCRSGGCGVCRVRVLAGVVESTGKMSRAHVSEDDERAGIVLCCRVTALSDLLLERVPLDTAEG